MDISQIAATTDQPKTTEKGLGKLTEDFNDFLKIMIVQLQNQDPTSPFDTNEFTSQIVSFTGVETALNTNKKLDQLIDLTQNTQNSNILSFTGKNVEVNGSGLTLEETGDASFSYSLDKKVKDSFVTIVDSKGDVVFNGTGKRTADKHTFTWDGNDNKGNRAAAGNYMVMVTAEDFDGVIDKVPTKVKGRVTGVNLSENSTLVVNGEEIPLEEVSFITE